MRRLLREPVLHFTLLGAVFFGWFSLVNDDAPAPAQSSGIVISQGGVQQIIGHFRAVWRRNPSPQELAALIDGAVHEEVLVREALALGLDRGGVRRSATG